MQIEKIEKIQEKSRKPREILVLPEYKYVLIYRKGHKIENILHSILKYNMLSQYFRYFRRDCTHYIDS